MDVIQEHARRLPDPDENWTLRPRTRSDLDSALLEGGVAGVASHDLENVHKNVSALIAQDPDKLFGLSRMPGRFDHLQILELIAAAAGSPIDPDAAGGDVFIEPAPVLDACLAAGNLLATAAEKGQRVLMATGHPVGLGLLYLHISRLLSESGAMIVTPADGLASGDPYSEGKIRYYEGVGMLTDHRAPRHTHSPEPMRMMLSEIRPDLVVADHGFAGAAIDEGIPTIGIADVNDPALIVAKAQGRTDVVLVMDDNVAPTAYWPCFQAIAAAFP